MTIDQRELLVGFEPLPFQAREPVLEEAPCPALALVVPELAEGLLSEWRCAAACRREQDLQVRAARRFSMREQRIFLP